MRRLLYIYIAPLVAPESFVIAFDIHLAVRRRS
jgi:hypothetical protein